MDVWYVLEDGRTADPNEVAPDAAGVLRHVSGVAVAIGPHGPRSRGVDAVAERARAAVAAGATPEPEAAARAGGYATRQEKAR